MKDCWFGFNKETWHSRRKDQLYSKDWHLAKRDLRPLKTSMLSATSLTPFLVLYHFDVNICLTMYCRCCDHVQDRCIHFYAPILHVSRLDMKARYLRGHCLHYFGLKQAMVRSISLWKPASRWFILLYAYLAP